ncbi:DpnI domain-containing protein [Runella slithyformis]|uniref:Type II site-specific deoxyribonuclease n=1 Tax=Runella slithyformis (strain ATCC 29530 / DSM 19594 / LMG 11500 / NCIMB 11436 / LSU 4) TaxID=761193 RepID=A0A7U4E805_RUNSL|nr:DpnI domain-containing protein [Runella slithyformis]AEI50744.1 Type II site-specific deoxyribonuclease [Runella slithyformis DSM 19594]
MNLHLNTKLAEGYSSNSQIARILTENWVLENSYCPCCGEVHLHEFENNRPVADFYCQVCLEEYELKSKNGKFPTTINDGAYSTMIGRINSEQNPNFFFLTYSKKWSVENFLVIPKHFFTTEKIIKRNPLSETARRAGWVGCFIDISAIAEAGKVFLVKDSIPVDKKIVEDSYKKTLFLRREKSEIKGWLLDLLLCIDLLKKETFTLGDIYRFEDQLRLKHPDNNFIKDKIRQQLQVLRDRGFIEFIGRGKYKKVGYGNH